MHAVYHVSGRNATHVIRPRRNDRSSSCPTVLTTSEVDDGRFNRLMFLMLIDLVPGEITMEAYDWTPAMELRRMESARRVMTQKSLSKLEALGSFHELGEETKSGLARAMSGASLLKGSSSGALGRSLSRSGTGGQGGSFSRGDSSFEETFDAEPGTSFCCG